MPTNLHDTVFKSASSQPDLAPGELERLLPKEVATHLDLATLEVRPGSFVDEGLRHAHTDLLYTVRTTSGRDAFVYVLFEHQSSLDATMPFRLLRYVIRVWDTWLRDHPAASTLPLVLPVLLHRGATGWCAEPELASMLDVDPELLDPTRPFMPPFMLDELDAFSADMAISRDLSTFTGCEQFALWSSRSSARLQSAAPSIRLIAATISRDRHTHQFMVQLYIYLLRTAEPDVDVREILTILLEIAGPQGREDVMNAAEQLIEQGRAEGHARGQAEGLRGAIATALTARAVPMSELSRAQIEACTDLATLTRWLARAVTASSEADVFAGDTT